MRGSDFTIKARLVVSDFVCDPTEITRVLEISPTKIWFSGENVHPKASRKRAQNGWVLESGLDGDNSTIDDQISALATLISKKKGNFLSLPKEAYVELSFVVYAYNYRPGLSLSSAAVVFLASIRASIDIDIYDITPDDNKKDTHS